MRKPYLRLRPRRLASGCGSKYKAVSRRTWRKIHLAVDESAKDIIGIEVTTAEWGDSGVFAPLLGQVEGEISQVSADGAYDTEGTHAVIAERGARTTIPPRAEVVPREDIRAMRSFARLPPRGAAAGRTTAAITGATSPRT